MVVAAVGFAAGCGSETDPKAAPLEPASTGSSPVAFTDVTAESGLHEFRHVTGAFGKKWFPEAMGSGGVVIDYDGDDWPDMLHMGGGTWPQSPQELRNVLWLYRNNQDGTFTLVTEEAGLGNVDAYTLGGAVADYDNDGDEDVYVTTLRENLLFRNDDGVFTEVGAEAGVAGEPAWSSSAIFFDADRDGDVDLYVGNYVKWTPETDIFCSLDGRIKGYCTPETYEGIPSRFYRNNGDGTFTDASEEAGFLPAPGKTLGVAEFDHNGDGWPDLVVANDTQRDLLYENNGDGTFTEKGALSGIAYDENGKARAGMGIDTGVVDSTGQVSVFVGNFSKEMIGVYRHIGNGLFIDRAAVSKIGRPSLMTLTFGLFLFDVDLDGDLDLYAANGHVQPEIENTQEGIGYAEAPHIFINRGDGTFEDAGPVAGGVFSRRIVARGAGYLDFDRDGDLDIFMTENEGPVHLWRNEHISEDGASDGGFLRLALEGRESNRSALSTKVIAVFRGNRSERRIRSGSSYLSQSELPATFGVGTAQVVDSLIVEWSGGSVERFTDVPVNKTYRLVEGTGRLEELPMHGEERLARSQ